MYDYHLELPRRTESNSPPPIILFLHGAGECGGPLDNVQVHGPWIHPHPTQALRSARDNTAVAALIEQFYVVAPHLPHKDAVWDSDLLLALLEMLARQHPHMPTERLIVTGYSRGGGGALRFALAAPHRVQALAAFCPENATECTHEIECLADVPTWIFHNAHERLERTRPEQTSELFKRLRSVSTAGAQRTLFEAKAHNCWRKVYANPSLYNWFLNPAAWPEIGVD